MRKYFFVLLLTVMPALLYAQPNIQIGITGGANVTTGLKQVVPYNSFPFNNNGISFNHNLATGGGGTIKGLIDLRHWQFGIGVEVGTIKGALVRGQSTKEDIHRTLEYSSTYNFAFTSRDALYGQKIAQPYFIPHLLANYKINFSRSTYMYVGAVGGYMSANSQITWDGKASGLLAGANLGMVFKLTDNIGIDVFGSWRKTWVRKNNYTTSDAESYYNDTEISPSYHGTIIPVGGHVAEAVNEYNLSFVHAGIGLRFGI